MEKFFDEYAGAVLRDFVKDKAVDPLTLARLQTDIYRADAIKRLFPAKKWPYGSD